MTPKEKIRFTVVMAGLAVGLTIFYHEHVLGDLLAPLAVLTAQITAGLLHLLGMDVIRALTQIHHPEGFAYEIYYRCLGILPVIIYTAAVVAYPRSLKERCWGMVVGVPILFGLNLCRLVTLFYVGVYYPVAFDFTHIVFWEGLMFLATLGLWLGWLKWSSTSISNRPSDQNTPRLAKGMPLLVDITE